MKYDRLRTFLTAALLAAAVSIGSIGCLATGFSLTVDRMDIVYTVCILSALVGSGLLLHRNGGTVILCLLAVGAGYLWHLWIPAEQFSALAYRISAVYNGAYSWGTLVLTESADLPMAADYVLAAHGCLTALAVNRSVCRRKGTFLPVALGVLPVGLCLVVTDMVPGAAYLYVLLAGAVMLMLTGGIRRESSMQGNRLALGAAVPVIAMLALIFALCPQDGYVNRTASVRTWLAGRLEQLPLSVTEQLENISAPNPNVNRNTVDLGSLRGQSRDDTVVMELSAPYGGTVYLRGQDYDTYDGKAWTSQDDRTETLTGSGQSLGGLHISTRTALRSLYLPCYPAGDTVLTGGRITNDSRMTEYTVERYTGATCQLTPDELYIYLQLPKTTSDALSLIADRLPLPDATPDAIAASVESYVRDSAGYDRLTGAMPEDREDFVTWFLTESDTGYCVHFASAAVALLRYLGVPARYVTGYMTVLTAGETAQVTTGDAHAWAEYYTGNQWVVLEATPGDVFADRTVQTEQPTDLESQTAETEPAAPETLPGQTDSIHSDQPQTRGSGVSMQVLMWLAGVAIAAAAVWGQRQIRIRLRQRKLERAEPNARALMLWREIWQICRLLGEEPDETLRTYAEKAAYSPHTMTDGELGAFAAVRRQKIRMLQRQPAAKELVHMYIYALY